MSDRWHDELKKLRMVEPPAGLWDRAQEAPRGDKLPPRRERIVAGVVAMSVFAAAGAFAFQALRPSSPRTIGGTQSAAVLRLDAYPFEATLAYAGSVEQGVRGNSTWSFDNGMTSEENPFGGGVLAYAPIPTGTEIAIQGNVVDVDGWFETQSGDSAGQFGGPNQRTLDLPPARYVLHLHARWAQGVAEYDFGIEVVAVGSLTPEGSAIVVEAHLFVARGGGVGEYPDATLTFGGETEKGFGTSWSWVTSDNSSYVADTVGPDFATGDYLQIPSGAVLDVIGDAVRVDGSVQEGTTYPFEVVQDFGTIQGRVTLDLSPGRYVLKLTGHWPQGERDFYFAIEILAPASSERLAAVVELGPVQDALTVRSGLLSLDGIEQRGVVESFCIGGECTDREAPLPRTFIQIPQGRSITTVDGSPQVDLEFVPVDGGIGTVFELVPGLLVPLDLQPGRYRVTARGDWDVGFTQVLFAVRIVSSDPPNESPEKGQ